MHDNVQRRTVPFHLNGLVTHIGDLDDVSLLDIGNAEVTVNVRDGTIGCTFNYYGCTDN